MPSFHQPPRNPRVCRVSLAVWLGLGALVLLAYANSFEAALLLDSKVIVGSDPRIRAWTAENLRLIFTQGYWWPFGDSNLYRPVTTLSYLVNFAVFGNEERVFGYHAVNFLLHWMNAGLVFVLVRRLAADLRLAALAAAIFAMHPVAVESVTNIVGRADLLATLSILAGGWCYVRAADATGPRRVAWLAGLGTAALLGVFAKESAVMIGPFLVLYDWLWRWPKLPAGPLAARLTAAAREFGLKGYLALAPGLAALFVAHRLLPNALTAAGQPFVDNPIAHAGAFQGFMTAIQVIGRYLGLLVFPHTLSSDYSYNQIPLYGSGAAWWLDALSWGSLLAVVALVWFAVRWRTAHPVFAWGVLLFFAMLLPTSNLLIAIGSIMAERFLYLPSIGFAVVAALGLRAWADVLGRRGAAILIVLALPITALLLRTHVRNADWRDELTFWKTAVVTAPDSFRSHRGYAEALWNTGSTDAAIARGETGLAILDRTPLPVERDDLTLRQMMGNFYGLKGAFLQQAGRSDEARQFFTKSAAQLRRAIAVTEWTYELRRQALVHRLGRDADPQERGRHVIYGQLAYSYLNLRQWDELRATCALIQKFGPAEASGYSFAGVAEANLQHAEPAAIQLFAAFLLKPGDEEVRRNLARCYEALGVRPSPIAEKGARLEINAEHPLVRRHLNEAFALLVRNLEAGKMPRDAAALREMAIQRFQIPAELLGGPSPPAAK